MTQRNADADAQAASGASAGAAPIPPNPVNPTMNASLTPPGPAPSEAAAKPVGQTAAAAGSMAPAEIDTATLGSPKGGGETTTLGDVGAGRYGGASDDAPTSPNAGAATTLAALAADESEHQLRPAAAANAPGPDHETWQGGQATQQVMDATEEPRSHSGPYWGEGEFSEVH